MVKVIIGSGNVAQHLIAAFQNSKNTGDEIELVQVFSRKANTLESIRRRSCDNGFSCFIRRRFIHYCCLR
jgi:homoserine dehydrogenase